MIFTNSADDRKVRVFSLSQSFLDTFSELEPDWGPLGLFTFKRCVVVETPVLCDDLVWRPAGGLKEGQGILGFDAEAKKFRHVRQGVVLHNKTEMAETVGIELENGDILYATPDHPWLVRQSKTNNRLMWRESKDLTDTRKGDVQLLRPFGPVWAPDTTYEGGFLAAAFDGEGCFDRLNSLSFIQVDNPMLRKVEGLLDQRRIPYVRKARKAVEGRQQCFNLRINGRANFLPFLGSLRPPRLLEVFQQNVGRVEGDLGAFRCDPENYVKVVRVFPAGERKIAVLSTNLQTHFTGGYASHNTYARTKPDGTVEDWWETCQRVIEGCFNIQKIHCKQMGLPWNEPKAQKSAQEMFTRMWHFKFTPPGRGLWMMGTDLVYERGSAALQNCAFVSSENIGEDFAGPFAFLMDLSMLGVGVGSDTRGSGKARIQTPKMDGVVEVEDSREGWVDLLKTVLNSFVGKGGFPAVIDYSKVRGRGEPIKGFGGTASGPGPLQEMIEGVTNILLPEGVEVVWDVSSDKATGKIGTAVPTISGEGVAYRIDSAGIVDVFNFIGKCVVAGGVRRSAEIMFGEPDDEKFVTLKQDLEALNDRRWVSNNSVFGYVGMDYGPLVKTLATNGEPGIMWIENSRKFGRMSDSPNNADWRVMGTNPCGEQPLESYELCVASGTQIHHRRGIEKISKLVGEGVDIWNGDGWSTVTPRITGESRELFRVHLSDGSYLDCTGNHGWHIKPPGKRVFRRAETTDLVAGSQVVPFTIDAPIHGEYNPSAFEWGLFAGDGFLSTSTPDGPEGRSYTYPLVAVCGDKAKLVDLDVQGTWYKAQKIEGYTDPVNRLSLHGLLPLDVAESLRSKTSGLAPDILRMDRDSILEFMAGWIEADGSITNSGSAAEGFRLYGSEPKLRDAQILLRRVGIDHATLRLFAEAGVETNFGVRNYDLYYLTIPSYECGDIPTRLKVISSFGSRYATNNAHPGGRQIDRARKQKIIKVEKLEGLHTTYCFDEPENHMGVFGNALTYQCNLVETFPARHESYADFERTLKMAYLYAKTVTLVPTHDLRANAVMMRNRRIGCSMSGIVQAMVKLGRRTFLGWCGKGYDYVQRLDKLYSDWLGIPLSIKTTTVKPSGTVSLLCGSTPGIHYPHSEFYLRHVRVSNTSMLVQAAKDAGYEVNTDPYATDTSVVAFPVREEHYIKGKRQASIWEQFANAVDIQRHWADNQVSITVTFKPEEAREIQPCLEVFEDQLKGISLLPLGDDDHGYQFAPYVEIDEEEYNRRMALVKPLDLLKAKHEVTEKFCSNDTCMIG